jgi:hypothetical protein
VRGQLTGLVWDFTAMAVGLKTECDGACPARTRDGRPCQGIPVLDWQTGKPRNGRCRMQGGRSTGPRTDAGKAAIAASNRRRGAADRQPARVTG